MVFFNFSVNCFKLYSDKEVKRICNILICNPQVCLINRYWVLFLLISLISYRFQFSLRFKLCKFCVDLSDLKWTTSLCLQKNYLKC